MKIKGWRNKKTLKGLELPEPKFQHLGAQIPTQSEIMNVSDADLIGLCWRYRSALNVVELEFQRRQFLDQKIAESNHDESTSS